MKKKAIFLMGPTATGKTNLAILLSKKFPIEIISVDSAMIYKGMDIGTGKPSKEELQIAPHKLIDIILPNESYSVANFCNDAYALMEKAILQNKIPLLVGGTMMYFNALQFGLSDLPKADKSLRIEIEKEIEEKGMHYMHEKLIKLDPKVASKIHKNDRQRIQRALEVIFTSGKKMSDFFSDSEKKLKNWEIKNIVIFPLERKILHQRIEDRFYQMLEQGFVDEVVMLKEKFSLTKDMPSMRCVGYRQIFNYLAGEYGADEMAARSIFATRQLAKRQYTWLKKWKDLKVYDSEDDKLLEKISEYF